MKEILFDFRNLCACLMKVHLHPWPSEWHFKMANLIILYYIKPWIVFHAFRIKLVYKASLPGCTAHSPPSCPADSSFRSCTHITPAAFSGLIPGTGSQLALGNSDVSYEAWLADVLQLLHKGQKEEVFIFLGLSTLRCTWPVLHA